MFHRKPWNPRSIHTRNWLPSWTTYVNIIFLYFGCSYPLLLQYWFNWLKTTTAIATQCDASYSISPQNFELRLPNAVPVRPQTPWRNTLQYKLLERHVQLDHAVWAFAQWSFVYHFMLTAFEIYDVFRGMTLRKELAVTPGNARGKAYAQWSVFQK